MDAAPRSGAIVSVLAAAGILVSLMQTLIVPLIASLPKLLNTSAANASWAITATLLAGAVATPVAGRLGDLYGKRRVMVASALLLALGSLVCAPANSLAPMVAGRALQGFGMGVIPLGISIMRDVLPPRKLGSAIGLMSSSLGVGGALGLPAAALVAQHASWHALFWGSVGLGLLMTVLLLAVVPESPVRAAGRFDAVGALGLSTGLILLLLPVSKGGNWGWSSPVTLGMLAASAVVLLLWGWWELRVPAPLVDLRTSARRQVLMTNLASVVIGFAMLAMSLITPQLLQLPEATGYGLGRSMVEAGLWMAPAGLFMMAVSPLAARLSATRGPKVSLLLGAVVIACGYALALVLMGSTWGILIFSAVVSAGIGFAYAAMPALIMSAVPRAETAAANGLNSLMRSIGTSTASAVIGVVLANMTVHLGPVTLPSEDGFRAGFVIGGGVALLAALLVLAIPGRPASDRPAHAQSALTEAEATG
ncbi:MFS transporter [Nonomuraea sp. NPDC000554]|uniref:MFS transporter n=1 Tax=Nonomuraea sp. NPDC000554 TaxID=3154259 RepID=UPI0033227A80